MSRGFDLSGGKRGDLHGTARDTLQRPPRGRSARATILVAAFLIALGLAAGIALFILADGAQRPGSPTPERVVQTPEERVDAARKVRQAQRSAEEAASDAEDAAREMDRMMAEAQESFAKARETADGDSSDALLEAERQIGRAREQAQEDWGRHD